MYKIADIPKEARILVKPKGKKYNCVQIRRGRSFAHQPTSYNLQSIEIEGAYAITALDFLQPL